MPSPSRSQLLWYLVWAYVLGVLIGHLLALPYLGVVAMVTLPAGLLVSAPLLLIPGSVVVFLRNSLLTYPKPWCLVAPIVSTCFFVLAMNHVYGIYPHSPPIDLIAFAFLCSACSSFVFYKLLTSHTRTAT